MAYRALTTLALARLSHSVLTISSPYLLISDATNLLLAESFNMTKLLEYSEHSEDVRWQVRKKEKKGGWGREEREGEEEHWKLRHSTSLTSQALAWRSSETISSSAPVSPS